MVPGGTAPGGATGGFLGFIELSGILPGRHDCTPLGEVPEVLQAVGSTMLRSWRGERHPGEGNGSGGLVSESVA